jgi:sigma-E factor negative regulatory protein RseA
MTQKYENLSALVDGELQDNDMIKSIGDDQELSLKWQRYHLIRHGLRKELPTHADFDISAQVAKALADEPAILAPKRSWRDLPVVATVVPFAKQGGQLAIAASVAVAMVIGVQQYNQPELEQPFNNAPAVLPGIQGGLSPVSLEQTRPVQRADVLEQRRKINAFLTDHKQQLRLKTSEKDTPIEQAESEQEPSSPESEQQPE